MARRQPLTRTGKFSGLEPDVEEALRSGSSEDDSAEEEDKRRKKKKSGPALRIFNRAGNSGTVRMAEYREIDYEDLIAEEMGMKYRHQLCPHCWSKKKYKVTGRVKEEAGKKTKFVATDGSPAV